MPPVVQPLALLVAVLALSVPCAAETSPEADRRVVWRWLPQERVMPRLLAKPLEPATGVRKALGSPMVEARVGSLWDVVQWQGAEPFWGFARAAFGLGGLAIMQLYIDRYGEKSRPAFPFGPRQLVDFELETGDCYVIGEQRYGEVAARYRLHVAHVSAHLGDGRYDARSDT